MHGEEVSGNLPVAATSSNMTKECISGEMDIMQSGTFVTKKHFHVVPYWKIGEPSFWHHGKQSKIFPSDHDLFASDMQASMLK